MPYGAHKGAHGGIAQTALSNPVRGQVSSARGKLLDAFFTHGIVAVAGIDKVENAQAVDRFKVWDFCPKCVPGERDLRGPDCCLES